jgi:hypothetical protein
VTRKARSARKNTWCTLARYTSKHEAVQANEPDYNTVSLTVKLRFSGKLIVQELSSKTPILGPLERTKTPDTPEQPKKCHDPDTPATVRTVTALNTPRIVDSIESIHTYPLYQRAWMDETQNFNMKHVRTTLRKPDAKAEDIGQNYAWYSNAVPVDALLPPGIPLSAKEIHAFYPHHVRWLDIMLRLTNNDYRGADIMGMQVRQPEKHKKTR